MMIILLVGMPGSGKEEFINVAKRFGYEIVRMGDVVREFVKAMNVNQNDINVGRIAREERAKNGMDIWAKRTLSLLKEKDMVIDGIRNIEEVEYFRAHLKSKLVIVGIFTSEKNRFERIMMRNRIDDVHSIEEFKERDNRELSWGLGTVLAKADVMILNENSLEEYHRKIEVLLNELKH